MKQLFISYTKDGDSVSDFDVEEWATSLIKHFNNLPDNANSWEISVSNTIMIDQMRVMIKRGNIDYKKVVIEHNSEIIRIDKSGNLEKWPNDFCNKGTDLLGELIGWK